MDLDPQAQKLIELMEERGYRPFDQMSLHDAREMLAMFGSMHGPAEDVAEVRDIEISGPGGAIAARVYRPDLEGPLPVLVYFHGGGFVLGDIETADGTCRTLANAVGCIVVSVDYRLAPEHPWPAGADDCYAATAWVADHAAELGGRGDVIGVAGDSAGGNLAAVTCLMARDRGGPPLALQILAYPATQIGAQTASRDENGEGYLLTRGAMLWFETHYQAKAEHPYASPLAADDLISLPPAIVVTAGFDPLRDEGDLYAQRLDDDGIDVLHLQNPGMIHGFLGLGSMIEHAWTVYGTVCNHAKAVFADYIRNTP